LLFQLTQVYYKTILMQKHMKKKYMLQMMQKEQKN